MPALTSNSTRKAEVLALLEARLRLDVAYLSRLDPATRKAQVTVSRLARVFEACPEPQVEELRATLEALSIQNFAELQVQIERAEVFAKLEKFDFLPEAVANVSQVSAAGDGDTRVVLVCMDPTISADAEAVAAFREHVSQRRAVIPLILPGYAISDFTQWWPANMPEMAGHALFVDCRRPALFQIKVARELLPQVNKFLEEWRGEVIDPAAFRDVLSAVPCRECVRTGVADVKHFSRDDAQAMLERWREDRISGLGRADDASDDDDAATSGGTRQSTADGQGPQDGDVGEMEESLVQTCAAGHQVRVVDILSRAVIYDAVACPQCVQKGEVPPFCFNRRRCLLYFDEDNAGRVGAMECLKCLQAGRSASIRILDIIAPEVFLSYNWGVVQTDACGHKHYSTQALVKPLKQRLETEEDIVCWFDVGGGMGAGQNHMAEMAEGIRKCTVVVVFLSDAYVNSGNCLREFCHAVRLCKFLVPVLVPTVEDGVARTGHSTGWTGPGASDPDWWKHAARKCENARNPDSNLPISWSVLRHFEPVDMRAPPAWLAGSESELEIRRRIASRFHRGEHVQHKTEASYALWVRTRAKVRHALTHRRAGVPTALFPDIRGGAS